MSRYVDEIVKSIKKSPKKWSRYGVNGLINSDENIVIDDFGNGKLLSICNVYTNGNRILHGVTYMDKYKLESAYNWWFKNATLEMVLKK